MTDEVRLPRNLSEAREPPKPVRPSHQKVIEQVERWANSPGLQPPRTEDAKTV
jgi:ABC-type thiamine transport system substrate-binding protein